MHQLAMQSYIDCNMLHGAAQGAHGAGHGFGHGAAHGFAHGAESAANAGTANDTATATANATTAIFLITPPSFLLHLYIITHPPAGYGRHDATDLNYTIYFLKNQGLEKLFIVSDDGT
jgi:hypothetical protein